MEKKKKGIPLNKKQVWIDTFVYLCLYFIDNCCASGGKPYTNCTGRGTYSWGGCSHVKEFFDTYIKFATEKLKF